MRDILPSGSEERRSIRNIPISPSHRPSRLGRPAVEEDYSAGSPPPRPRRGRSRRALWGALAILGFGGLFILFSTVFAGATVTVYPRTAKVDAPEKLEARLNAPPSALAYETFTVTRSATTSAPATGTKTVSRQASGVIAVSNSYSSANQRLIANTRFEAPDGKIYRIRDSVTVPGMSGGKAGVTRASIYADSPGPEYNRSSATVFTIPGFKGDPRYGKFSARSEGPIEGGFLGEEPAVASGDLSKAREALQKQLGDDVRAAAKDSVPEGYVSVPDALEISYSEISQSKGNGGTANISQSATGKGVMIRANDLATMIARQKIEEYGGEAIGFDNISQLSISTALNDLQNERIVLALKGSPTLVWQFDPDALVQALLGKEKGSFQEVVDSFAPAIHKADASIRPFWHSTFPADAGEIKIVVSKND